MTDRPGSRVRFNSSVVVGIAGPLLMLSLSSLSSSSSSDSSSDPNAIPHDKSDCGVEDRLLCLLFKLMEVDGRLVLLKGITCPYFGWW